MHHRISEADPLSRTLNSLSLPDWQAGEAVLARPWGIIVPDGCVCLYAIKSGECWLTRKTSPTSTRLRAGDIVLVADGVSHQLHDSPRGSSVPFRELTTPTGLANETHTAKLGATTLVHGHSAAESMGIAPFPNSLPEFLHMNPADYDVLKDADTLLRLISEEQAAARPGWQGIVNHLMHVLFHQTLRAFVTQCAEERPLSLLSSTMDPLVGPAVGLMHSEPGKPWTVATLAREVNMSRSAFSDRFRNVVGKPPLQYLTQLRMQRASDLLRHSELGIKQIASVVGYESPSSFTNAFKRWAGSSPACYRRTQTKEN